MAPLTASMTLAMVVLRVADVATAEVAKELFFARC